VTDRRDFSQRLRRASDVLIAKQDDLRRLGAQKRVLIYSFGACGKNLARQLRAAGVDCIIFDNANSARDAATSEGFETTATLPADLPLIVAAGQNQLAIFGDLQRPAYNLVEGLYAFDLLSSYGRARLFADRLPETADSLYEVYLRLDPDCRAEFLSVLLFRASLDVAHLASRRTPVARMWVPPPGAGPLRSFCDVGAYDGDTLAAMKAVLPELTASFAVEPNPDLTGKIDAAARRLGLTHRTFVGLAWSHATALDVRTLPNGMMIATEAADGAIAADTLDRITASDRYDYVKFDVEGAEVAALNGAKTLLRGARCIAVAAYHVAADIVDIPNHVEHILKTDAEDGWKCAFGHYSECFEDSIFYFYR
jgi:FkbM family methyltransferase